MKSVAAIGFGLMGIGLCGSAANEFGVPDGAGLNEALIGFVLLWIGLVVVLNDG